MYYPSCVHLAFIKLQNQYYVHLWNKLQYKNCGEYNFEKKKLIGYVLITRNLDFLKFWEYSIIDFFPILTIYCACNFIFITFKIW
jgi:hypothetical protein